MWVVIFLIKKTDQYTFYTKVELHLYFTTKRLHEKYRVSSGQYRWIYCPLVPEGSIKLSVMPAGKKNEKKCFFSLNLTDFNKLFFKLIR